MSKKSDVDPRKTKAIQERTKERNTIVQEIRRQGPLTVEELSRAMGVNRSHILKHLIAMGQFGKVSIVGERDNQFVYGLPKET